MGIQIHGGQGKPNGGGPHFGNELILTGEIVGGNVVNDGEYGAEIPLLMLEPLTVALEHGGNVGGHGLNVPNFLHGKSGPAQCCDFLQLGYIRLGIIPVFPAVEPALFGIQQTLCLVISNGLLGETG